MPKARASGVEVGLGPRQSASEHTILAVSFLFRAVGEMGRHDFIVLILIVTSFSPDSGEGWATIHLPAGDRAVLEAVLPRPAWANWAFPRLG